MLFFYKISPAINYLLFSFQVFSLLDTRAGYMDVEVAYQEAKQLTNERLREISGTIIDKFRQKLKIGDLSALEVGVAKFLMESLNYRHGDPRCLGAITYEGKFVFGSRFAHDRLLVNKTCPRSGP